MLDSLAPARHPGMPNKVILFYPSATLPPEVPLLFPPPPPPTSIICLMASKLKLQNVFASLLTSHLCSVLLEPMISFLWFDDLSQFAVSTC